MTVKTISESSYALAKLPLEACSSNSCSARTCLILSNALPSIGTSIASGDTCGNTFLHSNEPKRFHEKKWYILIPPGKKCIYLPFLPGIIKEFKKAQVKPL